MERIDLSHSAFEPFKMFIPIYSSVKHNVGITTFDSLLFKNAKISIFTGSSNAPLKTKNKHSPGAVKYPVAFKNKELAFSLGIGACIQIIIRHATTLIKS